MTNMGSIRDRLRRNRKWLAAAAAVLAAGGLAAYFGLRGRIPEVPLGVEHAVTIAYNGPELTLVPYRRGVDVNLRIARVIRRGEFRVYDIRYLVNRPGEYDITGYLMAASGKPTPGLPGFKVRGVSRLSKAVDRRIRETEKTGVSIWHWYDETMTGLVAFWAAWLLLLIFWRRRRPAPAAANAGRADGFAPALRRLLGQLRDGTLDVQGKARLEYLMFDHWKSLLAPAQDDMYRVVRAIGADAGCREQYAALESWIHNPVSTVSGADVEALLLPYTVEQQPGSGSA